MSAILVSALAALLVFAGSMTFRKIRKDLRQRRFKGLELRPNCLLTRYPIVFLAGKRSIFRPFEHWNDVPLFLREHGYEVAVLEPVTQWDVASIHAAIADFNEPCHLIGDASLEKEIEGLSRQTGLRLQSITLVRNKNRSEARARNDFHAVHSLRPRTWVVEIFEVEPALSNIAWIGRVSLVFLALHNLFRSSGTPVDPLETAELLQPSTWKLEERFLDLAISLAERDAQWSD